MSTVVNTTPATLSTTAPSMATIVAPPPVYGASYPMPTPLPGSLPPPYMGTPSPPVLSPEQERMRQFRAIAGKYEIRPDFCERLRQLEDYEIIVIADDSGSMNTRTTTPSTISSSAAISAAFAPSRTRWTELLEFCSIVSEIATVMDKDGIDIFFLNRPPALRVTSATNPHFQHAFASPPSGTTPLVSVLQHIIATKCRGPERKVLIIIATDGEPDGGSLGISEFVKTIKYRPTNTNITLLACTDDEASVEYMNTIDRVIPGVDVVDDYQSELLEVRRAQGEKFPFSYGDYIVKILLGSIDPEMDQLDEKPVRWGRSSGRKSRSTCVCV